MPESKRVCSEFRRQSVQRKMLLSGRSNKCHYPFPKLFWKRFILIFRRWRTRTFPVNNISMEICSITKISSRRVWSVTSSDAVFARRNQKRNNKNVFALNGFTRWDTVQYKGRVGFISGFTGSSSCRIIDIHGEYIKNPKKKIYAGQPAGSEKNTWEQINRQLLRQFLPHLRCRSGRGLLGGELKKRT